MAKDAGKWAWKNREIIAMVGLTAAMFVPGLGQAVAVVRIASIASKAGNVAKLAKVVNSPLTRQLGSTALKAVTQGRTVRSAKSAKEVVQKGKYAVETRTVNARNVGGAARAVYTKIKINGRTREVYKDTFSRENKFLHRKYKVRGRS